jgi:dihydrodipicolinate reductase
MINVGILGSISRVGSLLIDDLLDDESAKLSACHVLNKMNKTASRIAQKIGIPLITIDISYKNKSICAKSYIV